MLRSSLADDVDCVQSVNSKNFDVDGDCIMLGPNAGGAQGLAQTGRRGGASAPSAAPGVKPETRQRSRSTVMERVAVFEIYTLQRLPDRAWFRAAQ